MIDKAPILAIPPKAFGDKHFAAEFNKFRMFLLSLADQVNVRAEGYTGYLRISEPAPTVTGLYKLIEVGTYSNLIPAVDANGNPSTIISEDGKLNEAYFDAVHWIKSEIQLPQAKKNIINFSDIPSEDFPLVNVGAEKIQVVHEGVIFQLKDGETSLIEDIPGTSPKWNPVTLTEKQIIDFSAIQTKQLTITDIQDDIMYDEGSLGMVYGEENPNSNGIYKKISGAGSGGWEKTNFVNPVFKKSDNMSIGGGLSGVYESEPGTGFGNVTYGINVGNDIGAGWANILFGYNVGTHLGDKSIVNSWTKALGNVGNIFFGYNVAPGANGALDNTIMGNSAGQNLSKGMDNSIFGIWAGKLIEDGSENAFYGHYSGGFVIGKGDADNIDQTSQDENSTQYSWGHRITAYGNLSGTHDLGGNPLNYIKKCVYVGSHTRGNNWAINENVFGYKAQGRGSNTVSLGNEEIEETHFYGILSNWTDRTFADLPEPNRSLVGARSFILDADTRIFDAIVSGGGSNQVPIWCDGSSWRVG
ncbi:hypothetical protein PFY12_14555 [Chryseobacterium camelliae]|uniref:Phage tail protein n=1 Tax=Chryseobacterium camelliae TaxID=1265445 RepID=A0ABY7QMK0_9FLAO|nr:hypothetical protein [Chryseobacterium camelliae]WBV60246.1 hypothetical protein PFY12_14555 [Chryseobacterium camelliae]